MRQNAIPAFKSLTRYQIIFLPHSLVEQTFLLTANKAKRTLQFDRRDGYFQ